MNGLNKVISHLRAMQPDMARMANIGDAIAESRVLEYIECADAQQCKDMVDALVNRVGDLLGDATHLEDAAAQLSAEIEAQEEHICSCCDGSGEGQYEGTTCRMCKGGGTELKEAE